MVVQSVIVSKDLTLEVAKGLVRELGYMVYKIDNTRNYYRFRQVDPDELRNKGMKKFRTETLNKYIKIIHQY